MNIEYIFIIPIIILGIVTSYTDIKFGIIKNKHIMYSIYAAIVCHIIVFLTYRSINISGYSHYFINSIFILFISFIFWNIGLWTAGDAKLFFALNLLSPPLFIVQGYMGMFYGIVYFTNIFGLLLLFLTYKTIRKIKYKELKYCFKETFNLKTIAFISLFMFAMGSFVSRIPQPQPSNFITSSLIFFVILMIFRTFAKDKMLHVIIILSIIRLFIDIREIITIDFWMELLAQMIILLIAMFLILRASFYTFTEKIKLDELKEKMFLAEDIIKVTKIKEKGENDPDNLIYKKQKIENLTIFSYLENQPFKFENYNKNLGLNKENINWIKENRKKLKFSKIRIYETMPFAPFISAGVILTILAQGNIFIFIVKALSGI